MQIITHNKAICNWVIRILIKIVVHTIEVPHALLRSPFFCGVFDMSSLDVIIKMINTNRKQVSQKRKNGKNI